MPDETTEEFAPFFARELRENWLKNVASASAMWMRIEDFILELERLEEMAYTGHYLSKAKEMKSRLSTLELRFRETSRASLNVVDQAVLDIDLLLIALTTYRGKLREAHLGEADEKNAAKATVLHPVSISKRAKAQRREQARATLTEERKARTNRSHRARAGETS